MKATRLLQQEALIDQRVEHLLRQPHRLDHLGAQRLPVHLLVILLGVVERAVVFAKGNRFAIHSRGVGAILLANAARTTQPHVDIDEADHERRNHSEQSPLQLLEVVAHHFEHWEDLFAMLDRVAAVVRGGRRARTPTATQ